MSTTTIDPQPALRGNSKPVKVRGMVSRKNLNALTELGARRAELRTELEEIETKIDKVLVRTYPEGWTWPELMTASSFSLGTLRLHLKKLGLTTDDHSTRRPKSTPVAQERKAADRKARISQ